MTWSLLLFIVGGSGVASAMSSLPTSVDCYVLRWWHSLASLAFSALTKKTSSGFMCIFCDNPVEVLLAGELPCHNPFNQKWYPQKIKKAGMHLLIEIRRILKKWGKRGPETGMPVDFPPIKLCRYISTEDWAEGSMEGHHQGSTLICCNSHFIHSPMD